MPHEHDTGSLVPESKDNSKNPSPFENMVFDGIINPDKDDEGKPSVGFDYRRYEYLLADTDISPEDKRRVIEAIWDIVTSFIRLGFGVHPVQQALNAKAASERDTGDACTAGACGKPKTSKDTESDDLLHSNQKEDV